MKDRVYIAKTQDPYRGAAAVLDRLNFSVKGKKVFIKPNLTGCRPSCEGMGVDTGLVRAVLERLVDMRQSEQVWKPIPRPYHTGEMPFAAEIFEHDYLVNIAKLKTHSLAGVTLCLKNIFGFIPTRQQKLMYHPFIRAAVLDMNQVIRSDFCLVDGVWGNEFDEIQSTPVHTGVVIAGENILAVDRTAAAVMGVDTEAMDTYQKAVEIFGEPEVDIAGEPLENVRRDFRQGCLLTTRFRYIKEATQSVCYRCFCRH